MLRNIWTSKTINTRTKLHTFNSSIKSVLLYGYDTRRTTNAIQWKLQNFFTTRLRRIFNIGWVEKIRERAGQESLKTQIWRRKWGWIGHTLRKLHPASLAKHYLGTNREKGKRDPSHNTWARGTRAEMNGYQTNWMGVTKAA